MKLLPTLTLPNATAWSNWLATHSPTSPGVTLTLAKKGVSHPTSLSLDGAVQEALCHGWINGQSQKIDDSTYSQRFTPRGSRSIWSKRNVGLVEMLEREGRMQASGCAAVEAARKDGRWERVYSGAANLGEMQDLIEAVKGSSAAEAAWNGLGQGYRSQIYFRLAGLKTQAGREKNIREFVAKLERGDIGDPPTVAPSVARKRGASECDEGVVKGEHTQVQKNEKDQVWEAFAATSTIMRLLHALYGTPCEVQFPIIKGCQLDLKVRTSSVPSGILCTSAHVLVEP